MGQPDISTKEFMQNPNIFAEIFNYLIYNGDPVIQPESLIPFDPVAIIKSENTLLKEYQRDLLMYWNGMYGEDTTYLLLGIENQTHVDYAMPARIMTYDSLQYSKQLRDRRQQLKKIHYKDCSDAELLSGFRKTDRLKPVLTVVVYFGHEPWDGPTRLSDLYEDVDEETKKQLPDYPLHLITPDSLTDSDLASFSSGFEQLMLLLRDCPDQNSLVSKCMLDPRLQNLDIEVANVINSITKLKIPLPKEGGTVKMFEAFIQLKETFMEQGLTQGHKQGLKLGLEQGLEQGRDQNAIYSISALMRSMNLTVAQAMDALEIPFEKREYYLSMLVNADDSADKPLKV